MTVQVGICGLGAYLPPEVRTNDWWDVDIVQRWQSKADGLLKRIDKSMTHPLTPGEKKGLAAMEKASLDPFLGCKTRHIISADMESSDMEAQAVQAALHNAGIRADQIDCVLSHTVCPDFLLVNSAAIIQHKAGLPKSCFALSVDGMCGSFLMQLHLAEQLIRGGKVKYAVLVQSSAVSRLSDQEASYAPALGDGATALVVGAVAPNHGVLSSAFTTDGSLHKAFLAGVPNKHWYDDGRVVAYNPERAASHITMVQTADVCSRLIAEVMDLAHVSREMVDFLVCHQPLAWVRPLIQELCGLEHTRFEDTFTTMGSMVSVNVPMQLTRAAESGNLKAEDTVVLSSYASGVTAGAMVLRWGT